MTVRAFRKQKEFRLENFKRVNSNLRMDFHNYSSNAWLGFRLELLGSLVFCLSALFMILLPSNIIKPGKLLKVDLYNGCLVISHEASTFFKNQIADSLGFNPCNQHFPLLLIKLTTNICLSKKEKKKFVVINCSTITCNVCRYIVQNTSRLEYILYNVSWIMMTAVS